MRIATLLAVLVLVCGTALADKVPDEKDWSFDLTGLRNVTEVEPNDACPGQEIACGDVVDAYLGPHTVAVDIDYFTFYATAGTNVIIGTDAGPDPDAYDTQLTLYNADCSVELAYDDDGGPGWYSLIDFEILEDGWYVARVNPYPYTTLYEGNYVLFVACCDPAAPPANDTCEGAIVIDRCSTGVIEGASHCATNDYDLLAGNDCTGWSCAGNDVTYVMDLEAGDVVDMFYFGSFDESIYIVTDCADPVGTCQIGADDTIGSGETITAWVAPATGTYYVIADAFGTGSSGDFTIEYTITCPVTPNENMTWGKVKSMF